MLATVKVRPGKSGVRVEARATADLDGACARRLEKSIAGRKNARGAAEQKNGKKMDSRKR